MRDFKKRRYLFAFIITAAIFFLGFFFGFIMDIQRIDYFTSLNEDQKLNIRSLQLQYELVENIKTNDQCNAFRYVFDNAILELEQNRERLELYDQQSKVKQQDFEILRREYTLSQINFWQISKKLKTSCPENSDFVTVLYFFSDTENCPNCERQASILNYYKSNLKENLLIFAIDERFEDKESLITLMKKTYEINSYPTLIIGDVKYDGVISEEDLGLMLCKSYSSEINKAKVCP